MLPENIFARCIIGLLLSTATYLFGYLDTLLTALIALIVIDFVTGTIKAITFKKVSSDRMFLGGVRKAGIMSIVAVANIIDGALDLGGMLRALAISYFIANEGISILENWSMLGLPIPERLKSILALLHDNKRK